MIVLLWIQITLKNKHKKKQKEMQPEQIFTVPPPPPLRLRPRPHPRPRPPPHAIVVKCSSISVLLFNPIYTFDQKNIHTLRPQRKHHKNYFVWILFFYTQHSFIIIYFYHQKISTTKTNYAKNYTNYLQLQMYIYIYTRPDTYIQKKKSYTCKHSKRLHRHKYNV